MWPIKLVLAAVLMGTPLSAYAAGVLSSAASETTGVTVSELDGAPTVGAVTEIKVTNGSLTDNGDGTVSVATSGASNITIGTSAVTGGTVGGVHYTATGPVLQELTGAGLLLVNSLSAPTIYAGVTCTNQVLRLLSAVGAGTCVTLTSAYVDTSIWTGTAASGLLKASSQGVLTQALAGTDYVDPSGTAATASALVANGANCSAGSFPLGVDANGAAETCTALPTTIAGTANQITASAATGAVTLSISSTLDLTSKTVRLPNSTSLPGTCTVGDVYFDTDATAGQNQYGCTGTNVWTLQGDGGAGSGLTKEQVANLVGFGF